MPTYQDLYNLPQLPGANLLSQPPRPGWAQRLGGAAYTQSLPYYKAGLIPQNQWTAYEAAQQGRYGGNLNRNPLTGALMFPSGHTSLGQRIGNAVSNFGSNAAGGIKGLATQAPGALASGAGNWFQHYLGTPEGRKQLAIIGGIAAGGVAAGGGFGGGAGATGAGVHGGADVFGTGLGTAGAGTVGAAGALGPSVPSGVGGASTLGALAPSEVAGNAAFIGAPGLGTGVAAATPWYNTYWGQAALNTGGNLLSGFLNNRAIQNAQNQSNQQIEDRLRRALAALSPAQIMALMQQFLPQMASNASQAGQTAIQAVREQAARTGQLESPRTLSFEAGTRAKLAADIQRQAFEAAFNTAGAQAGAITGAPYTPIQPQLGYADAITRSIQQAREADFYRQANQQQPGVPWFWNPYARPAGG